MSKRPLPVSLDEAIIQRLDKIAAKKLRSRHNLMQFYIIRMLELDEKPNQSIEENPGETVGQVA